MTIVYLVQELLTRNTFSTIRPVGLFPILETSNTI